MSVFVYYTSSPELVRRRACQTRRVTLRSRRLMCLEGWFWAGKTITRVTINLMWAGGSFNRACQPTFFAKAPFSELCNPVIQFSYFQHFTDALNDNREL